MALRPPPEPARLKALPDCPLAGRDLHRVVRAERGEAPWYFASTPASAGRFDLPEPDGSCYLACTAVAATLETLSGWDGAVPVAELADRRRVALTAPAAAPLAADLAAPAARSAGVTAALWAGPDRGLTQAWAHALHEVGWQALHHKIQHDPSGTEQAFTLFDRAGAHAPYDAPDAWVFTVHTLHDDDRLLEELARFGVDVIEDTTLDVIPLDVAAGAEYEITMSDVTGEVALHATVGDTHLVVTFDNGPIVGLER